MWCASRAGIRGFGSALEGRGVPPEVEHLVDRRRGIEVRTRRGRSGPSVMMVWMSDSAASRSPGPRRPAGAPRGPDEVRLAVLDAAATLFAWRGVDAVSLRDVAAEADVNLALIRRYVGSRDDLIVAVFDHVSDQLAKAVAEHPLAGQGYSPDTVMGQWVRIGAALAISGRSLDPVRTSTRSRRSPTPWSPATACRAGGPGPRGADRGDGARVADLRGVPGGRRRSGRDTAGSAARGAGALRPSTRCDPVAVAARPSRTGTAVPAGLGDFRPSRRSGCDLLQCTQPYKLWSRRAHRGGPSGDEGVVLSGRKRR